MPKTITLRKPYDMHLHLRDGLNLKRTVIDASREFSYAVIMPNLVPPITNYQQAYDYYLRITEHVPQNTNFKPLMTLYLTDQTSASDIKEAYNSKLVVAAKLYPAGATTNSALGVTSLDKIYSVLEVMAEISMPLLLHGEVADFEVDVFEREAKFIEQKLIPLVAKFPNLKVVLEHITTKDAVQFVTESAKNIAATITPQHLMYNRNHMLVGGIKPHLYCLPILKKSLHQKALINAAISGNAKFFLGTDSAPHVVGKKENSCGCAGCYSAFHAIELYAEVFAEYDALDKLESFSSEFSADFYGLEHIQETITLVKKTWQIPDKLSLADEHVIPLNAGQYLNWQLMV